MLLSSADAAALQAIASTYVREAVHQAYAVDDVDRRRWRRVGRHGALSLFRERVPFGPGASLAYDERKVGSRLFADPALFPTSLLLGAVSGDLDNLMLGLLTPSAESLALQQSYLGGVRDSGIEERVLATVVAPSFHDPLRSLTLRWRGIKQSRHRRIFHPDADSLARDQDGTVFLRSTGIAHLADGERVGYELVHSVGMALGLGGLCQARRNGCLDPKLSYCSIYRQRGRDTIDVYSLGAATPRLGEKLADFGADNGARKMRMLSRFEVCGQLQKLAWVMAATAEPATLSSSEHSVLHRPRTCCASCFRSFSGAARIGRRIGQLARLGNGGGTGVTECSMCSDAICGRCIVRRRLRFVQVGDDSRPGNANQVSVIARSLPFCFKCIQRCDEMSTATVAAHALLDEDDDSMYDLGSGSCQAWCNYVLGTPTPKFSPCKSPASTSNQTFFCVDDDDTVEEIPVSDGKDSDVAECDVIRGTWHKRRQFLRLESNDDVPVAVSDVDDCDLWTLESLDVASLNDDAFHI